MNALTNVEPIGIAAWIALLAFPVLLTWGVVSGELTRRRAAVFVALAVAAWVGLPRLPYGEALVTSALAVIDIALVFAVFKGDVRIG